MSDNIYYLYILLDPRKPGTHKYEDLEFEYEPFYVGISKNKNRYLEHLNEAFMLNINSHKCNKIRKIKKDINDNPILIKIFENLNKDEIIKLEIEYIKKIGRSDFGLGPLTNKTGGGEGVTNCDPNMYIENGKKIKQNYINNPEMVIQASIKSIELWNNEEYRKKQIKSKNNPESKNKAREKTLKRYEDPLEIEKTSNSSLKMWQDEKYIKKMLEIMGSKWLVTYINNEDITIRNMNRFCREHNLKRSSYFKCLIGKDDQGNKIKFKYRKLEK